MTGEDVASAKRLALGGLLVFMLWLLAGRMYSFAEQVIRQDREQKQTLEMLERTRQRELAITQRQLQSNRQLAQAPIPTKTARPTGRKDSRQKMSASAVVSRLRQVNAFGLVANPDRRLHCMDNQGDWDYTCLFQRVPAANAPWFHFGVIVDSAHIIEMSEAYPSSAALPAPLSAATR